MLPRQTHSLRHYPCVLVDVRWLALQFSKLDLVQETCGLRGGGAMATCRFIIKHLPHHEGRIEAKLINWWQYVGMFTGK